ncbi:unnamed protein product [Pseudo-nitzschia multistriata]|uniref:Thioredoxin domain-containing protein n=1 Tax=Pseudo-nitzschia multistriata TaxID=183589 RepID=A0A448ZS74_9STRA|nr:unnamed protein product [Pseudo-nitzschia multistriata]
MQQHHRFFLVAFAVLVSTLSQNQSLALLIPQQPLSPTTHGRAGHRLQMSAAATPSAVSSLSPVTDASNGAVVDDLAERLKGKRVALYFSAGWCPMCTSFEPALASFRQAASDSGKDVEIVYVPSDRSDADGLERARAMGMLCVSKERAADYKKEFKIWAGSETLAFGFGRRSGVPALVVLDNSDGKELAFLPAESQGARCLGDWPLDDESNGVW